MDNIEELKSIVKELLEKGFGDRYYAEFSVISDTEVKIEIRGDSVSYLIGQFGKTLMAFQMLVRQIYMNRTGDFEEKLKILIDIDGYKSKRDDKIKDIAKNAAERCISLNQNITLPVMNAYERHIVHDLINESFPQIKTESTGEEPNRRVVLTIN